MLISLKLALNGIQGSGLLRTGPAGASGGPGLWHWLGWGLVVLVLAILILPAIVRWQRRLRRQDYRLELLHQGNVRSRYELRVEEPTHGLTFEFLLNGVLLPPHLVAVGAANGSAPGGESPGPVASGGGLPTPATGASGGVRQTVGLLRGAGRVFSDLLYSLSLILPGTAGRPLVALSNQLRDAEWTAQRLEQIPQQVARLQPGRSPSGGSGMEQRAAAPRPYLPPGAVEIWVETPELEPEQVLVLQLRATPVHLYQSQAYTVTLISRPRGHPEATLVTESVIQVAGLTAFERWGPFLGFVALVLISLVIFLSWW